MQRRRRKRGARRIIVRGKTMESGGREMFDVIIIGAGVTGCAVARELSRYHLEVCVIDKNQDVGEGTSKANSGIVHAGFDAAPGSLMAKLNVEGNRMMGELAKELDFPFQRIGAMVTCLEGQDGEKLRELLDRGEKNGVPDLRLLTGEEARRLEPNLGEGVASVLYAPTGGIVCPFGLTIALAENACVNGVGFRLGEEVTLVERLAEGYRVVTAKGVYETKVVVNAAGVYADLFHNMVSDRKIKITARRGEYCLLDRNAGSHVGHTIFQLPGKYGKGILVTPTVHGNLLIGPNAVDVEDKENTKTTGEGLEEVVGKAGMSVANLPTRQVITSFAGLRAHEEGHEFIIRELSESRGFVDVAGIESPGLTSAPAIGVMAAGIVRDILQPGEKKDFIRARRGIVDTDGLGREELAGLIKERPEYGNIICRCEGVSEGEIIDAIRRPLGARTLDGVKRRTRAGMGRCQAGFCSPKVMEILAREWGVDISEITKCGNGSEIIVGRNKDSL